MKLDDIHGVLAVARTRSFRGVRLFHRTTRSVTLTEAGSRFIEGVAGPLSAIDAAVTNAKADSDRPYGTLRLNMAVSAARQLAGFFTEFTTRYPDMVVDVTTDDASIDIVRHGFDAGVRVRELVSQDMIAVPIGGPQRMVVVGSPVYLSDREVPETPMDLRSHRCVRGRLGGAIWPWEFQREQETLSLDVAGALILDDTATMIEAALNGAGLVYISAWTVREHLAQGRLVQVLHDWTPTFSPLCLYYSGHRLVPAGLRAMVAMARSFTKEPLPEAPRQDQIARVSPSQSAVGEDM
ncbi:LysR family transcriptional regulator [Mesorhizobium sp. CO1-1-4]|uniref:LysR family transcriptional regulator n=1 Tax=Mesorhizobium sp. CO1-1-4 TaxID=2876633 RepID=UPI001CCE8C7F|nr:LysR family transcriptional regulator [Mesorhizobium sp. CO1-1-4]MBZ9738685.1 LysR family transcriptional regulator [Mesorhizobium sp. CO1-1-4]